MDEPKQDDFKAIYARLRARRDRGPRRRAKPEAGEDAVFADVFKEEAGGK